MSWFPFLSCRGVSLADDSTIARRPAQRQALRNVTQPGSDAFYSPSARAYSTSLPKSQGQKFFISRLTPSPDRVVLSPSSHRPASSRGVGIGTHEHTPNEGVPKMRDTSLIISLLIFAFANVIQATICIGNFFTNVNSFLSQINDFCSICFSEMFANENDLLLQTSRLQTHSRG